MEAASDPKLQAKALAELFKLRSKNEKIDRVLMIGFKTLASLRRTIRVQKKNLKYQIAANNFVESKRILKEIRSAYEELSEVYFQFSRILYLSDIFY